MAISVVIHPETRREYFDDVLRDYPSLERSILKDFKICMESKGLKLASYMGCDQPYSEPAAARIGQLRHIHIALPPQVFDSNKAQSYRKCSMHSPELDAALVYAQGELYEDRYVILAFFAPNGHAKARVDAVMNKLGYLAKKFRDEN
ncbi:type II toxin-antitoxin system YafO family toxin [Pseudomonas prosekii]|uniref:type II toxin-antitoxin system YafO family toxin n=1 Tax=Pseudomonas prosekii TaxID=1148509 RepID=UPI00387ACC5C